MEEKELLKFWRENYKLPYKLTKEEINRFWLLESKPYKVRPEAVSKYSKKYNIRTLIETGTYQGAMVEAMLNNFHQIISIELDQNLFKAAKKKFAEHSHVKIVFGDSSKALYGILKSISEPCLFWLDGHYVPNTTNTARGNRDTPIMGELNQILSHHVRDHVILIDDARCFIGPNPVLNDYPTIQELRTFVVNKRPDLKFQVKDDIIRIHQ